MLACTVSVDSRGPGHELDQCPLGRRKADDEAGARWRVVAVLHVDFPVMAFDDCLSDRKAEAGMPSEIFPFAAVRMEAVKDRLTRIFGDAGTFVVDSDSDFVSDPRGGNLDQSSRRREADGIVDNGADGAGQTLGFAHHDRGGPARPGEGDPRVAALAPVSQLATNCSIRAEIDRFERGSGELSIGAGGLADIADQAVEADDVFPGDAEQSALEFRTLDSVDAFDCGSERGEGFLISCVTSAAKASILSILWRSDWLMSETRRASSPISSLLEGRRGPGLSRERPRRTRCAASASRRTGRAIVRARNSDRRTDKVMTTTSPRQLPRAAFGRPG